MTTRRRLFTRLTRFLGVLSLFGSVAGLGALNGCASVGIDAQPPIVFVHGNGDHAALWMTTLWRFESNGWPRERLVALDMPNPLARDLDSVPQAGRSGTDEQMKFLSNEVDKVLRATGASQVVLMGNSRGGNAIRHYIQNGGGAKLVSHAILGGTPNHGVWADKAVRPGNEFNGAGAFLQSLNAPKAADGSLLPAGSDGLEVTPGVRWLTLRSDNNDKFAQPDGVWIGSKGTPTHVTFDGPALKGAINTVLPERDHREVSYHAEAFEKAYLFITGRTPSTNGYTAEARVVLDGLVSGIGAAGVNNLPLVGASVEVYAVDPTTGSRQGGALLQKIINADGRWGPLITDARATLEFVVSAPGYAVAHTYRSPFPRSSSVVNLRAERLAPADAKAGAVVSFTRPRGYFGVPRDRIVLDGISPAPGIPTGVAGVAASKRVLSESAERAIVGEYRSGAISERIVGRIWPATENHLTTLELRD